MQPVRPSSFELAELCQRAPFLSVKYPASRAVTRFGSKVDRQVSALIPALASGVPGELEEGEEPAPETDKILDWLVANYPPGPWEYFVQRRVVLRDPETGEELTAGTPDLLCYSGAEQKLVDIDWKKRGQMWAGRLSKPDQNLQQLIYLTAAWLEFSIDRPVKSGKIVLACWDEKGVTPIESDEILEERLWDVIRRVKAVPRIDPDGKEPEASVGDHCDGCYQRMHCSEHLLPLVVVVKAGLPDPFAEFTEQPITIQSAANALVWLDAADRVLREAGKIRDLVEANVAAFTLANGPVHIGEMAYGPQPVKGRRAGATVATLENEGLQRLIREGKPSVKCKWYPSPKTPDPAQQ